MNKPLVVLFAGLVSLIATPAAGDGVDRDSPAPMLPGDYPTRPGDPGVERAAAKAAAKAKWDSMTPAEQAAARKAARQKVLDDIAKPLVGDFPNPNDYWKYRWPAPQEKPK